MELTDLEMKVMKIVWSLDGKASVNDVLEHWHEGDTPGYTTVLKVLQILEVKGVVRHRRKGRAYTYISKVDRGVSLRHNLGKLVSDFFGGNKALLAANLLSEHEFSPGELEEIKKIISQKERGKNL